MDLAGGAAVEEKEALKVEETTSSVHPAGSGLRGVHSLIGKGIFANRRWVARSSVCDRFPRPHRPLGQNP